MVGGALGGQGAVDQPQEVHLLHPVHLLRPVQTIPLESTKGFLRVFSLTLNRVLAGGCDSRAWYHAAMGRHDPINGVCHPGRDFDVDPSMAHVGLRAHLGVCASLNRGRIPRHISKVFPPKPFFNVFCRRYLSPRRVSSIKAATRCVLARGLFADCSRLKISSRIIPHYQYPLHNSQDVTTTQFWGNLTSTITSREELQEHLA
ncbi:hypothetical protein Taro_037915 [Colocasia esculenta]|uniref:Uncharacterized protein n=1 Tax=Colocasia esculenta TaxID=4460 RepID=A0A843WE93_COLES|nr:hypothetical protein [Colocasia esculenta]